MFLYFSWVLKDNTMIELIIRSLSGYYNYDRVLNIVQISHCLVEQSQYEHSLCGIFVKPVKSLISFSV